MSYLAHMIFEWTAIMLPIVLLIAWFTLPVLAWATVLCIRRHIPIVLVISLWFASTIAGTLILMNYVWAVDAQLLAEIDKYPPGSPQAERASQEWASDTGRSFLQLLSPAVTAFGYGFLFVFLFGLQWITRHRVPARSAVVHLGTDTDSARTRSDDGNPYRPPTLG